jgi:hypothetical protein
MKTLIIVLSLLSSSFTFAETFSLGGEKAKNLKLALLESGAKAEKRPLGSSALLKIGNVRCKFEAASDHYSCEIHQKNKVYDSRQDDAKLIFKTLQSKIRAEADQYENIVVRVKQIDCTTTTGMGPRTTCHLSF